MKNIILNEQLKIAINYWTKVLNESINEQYAKAAYDFVTAVKDGTIDISNLNAQLYYGDSTTYMSDHCRYDNTNLILSNFKIQQFGNDRTVLICNSTNDLDKSSDVTRLTIACIPLSSNSKIAFVFHADESYLVGTNKKFVYTVLTKCENGKLYLEYVPSTSNLIDNFDKVNLTCTLDGRIPTGIEIKDNLSHIASGYFSYFKNATYVTIDKDIKTIGASTFINNKSISNVIFDQKTKLNVIAPEAFTGTILTSIILPDSVTGIGYCAFSSSSLQNISMPHNLLYLDRYAFHNTQLQDLTLYVNCTQEHFGYYVVNDLNSESKLLNLVIKPGNCLANDFPMYMRVTHTGQIYIESDSLETVTFTDDKILDMMLTDLRYTRLGDHMIVFNCRRPITIYVPSQRFKDYLIEQCKNSISFHNMQIIIKK